MDSVFTSFMKKLNRDLAHKRWGAKAISKYVVEGDKYEIYCYTESPKVKDEHGNTGFLGTMFRIPPSTIPKTDSEKLARIAINSFDVFEAKN